MTHTEIPQWLHFTKMHGLGNDFMVIDAITQNFEPSRADILAWSDRHFGIGFDQLLLVETPETADVDFRYRIFNADGGEVEHCGNGARCFAKFVTDKGLSHQSRIRVAIAKGVIELVIQPDGSVSVDMGKPVFAPDHIPFVTADTHLQYPLSLPDVAEPILASLVSMGNPHAVIQVDNVDVAPVERWGKAVQALAVFPEQCNVGFMEVVSRTEIRLRVYERGAGETLACGTGACAAVVSGQRLGLLDNTVTVKVLGGSLHIAWEDQGSVIMTGPATTVYEGQIAWNRNQA